MAFSPLPREQIGIYPRIRTFLLPSNADTELFYKEEDLIFPVNLALVCLACARLASASLVVTRLCVRPHCPLNLRGFLGTALQLVAHEASLKAA